jgi:hypothetical protein
MAEGAMAEMRVKPPRARRGSRQNAEIATVAGLLGALIALLVKRGVIARADVDALLARERRDLLPLHQPHAGRMVDVIEFLTLLALAREDGDTPAAELPPTPPAVAAAVHEAPHP